MFKPDPCSAAGILTGTTAMPPAGRSVHTAVVSASSTNQSDRSWGADIVPGQGSSVATAPLTVYAAIPSVSNDPDLIRTDASKTYMIAPTPQVFHYDEDGNLKDDGVWSYTYDGENRLISVQNMSSAIGVGKIPAAAARKLTFTYDYLGRRVEKKVFGGWDGTNYSASALLDRKFAYAGWNLVAEYNAQSSNAIVRSYTWGLDITGSGTAAGGVGALVQITNHASSHNYYAAYDQVGNVVALDRDDGTLAAGYEYSPFGEPMRADNLDTEVADNPFRFSTKYTDLETGLVYYGMRYYLPSLGRFANRDPIQESGGVNLYATAGNNPISSWDVLGLDASDERDSNDNGNGSGTGTPTPPQPDAPTVDGPALPPIYVHPSPGEAPTVQGPALPPFIVHPDPGVDIIIAKWIGYTIQDVNGDSNRRGNDVPGNRDEGGHSGGSGGGGDKKSGIKTDDQSLWARYMDCVLSANHEAAAQLDSTRIYTVQRFEGALGSWEGRWGEQMGANGVNGSVAAANASVGTLFGIFAARGGAVYFAAGPEAQAALAYTAEVSYSLMTTPPASATGAAATFGVPWLVHVTHSVPFVGPLIHGATAAMEGAFKFDYSGAELDGAFQVIAQSNLRSVARIEDQRRANVESCAQQILFHK